MIIAYETHLHAAIWLAQIPAIKSDVINHVMMENIMR
jgi:hypothetical protein